MSSAQSYIAEYDDNTIKNNIHIRRSLDKAHYNLQCLLNGLTNKVQTLISCHNNVYEFKCDSKVNHVSKADSREGNTVAVNDMVEKIKTVFGLNCVQIAGILGVSRASLYNHISGKEAATSLEPYQSFYKVATQVESEVGVSLKPVLKTVMVDGRTLLSYLKDSNFSSEKILYVAKKVAEKIPDVKHTKLSIHEKRRIIHSVTTAG